MRDAQGAAASDTMRQAELNSESGAYVARTARMASVPVRFARMIPQSPDRIVRREPRKLHNDRETNRTVSAHRVLIGTRCAPLHTHFAKGNPMRLKSLGPNSTEIAGERVSVLFSYATPVAAHIEGVGYFRTETQHSVTTSRHINAFLGGAKARTVSQEWLDAMDVLAPSQFAYPKEGE